MPKRQRATKPRAVVPSETWEAKVLVNWLTQQQDSGHVACFSHLPLETRSKAQRLRNYELGTRAGVPDFVVVLPDKRVVWVELKRTKGGRVSTEQRAWVTSLGAYAKVCKGSQEACDFIASFFLRTAKSPLETEIGD